MKIIPIDRIIFEDDTGNKKTIKVPSIISLFWSNQMKKAYKEDPNRTYSIREFIQLMDIPCSKSALRSYIEREHLFINEEDGERMVEIRRTPQGLTAMHVARLHPDVRFIFEAVDKMKSVMK